MRSFLVAVKNESTGEMREIYISTTHAVDAQIGALRQLFRLEGWSNAVALPAMEVEAESAA